MKPQPAAPDLKSRFNHAAQVVEARFGDKPVWVKLAVFVPGLFVLTAVVLGLLYVVQLGIRTLAR